MADEAQSEEWQNQGKMRAGQWTSLQEWCRHPKWQSLVHDENFTTEARQYVRENGYVKGRPNLTLEKFASWVKEEWSTDICTSTASDWLHEMGFTNRQFSKGVYFDGHERPDVLEERKKYLATLEAYESRMLSSHCPAPDHSCFSRRFYLLHQCWSDGTSQALKQKSFIMVSDFVEEVGGLLEFEGEKACLLLEHQSQGYFTNDMLISQVHKTIDIFERKYPAARAMFIFDNAPSHTKKPDDALNPDRMNVKDGGKQPFMKDTVWDGAPQKMTQPDGLQKGTRSILEERGVDTKGMNSDKLREELKSFQDFCDKTTILEQEVNDQGHLCEYLPKFHCELNPIERCWCHAKKYTRAHCNGSIIRLRKIVPESFTTITMDMIARFFAKSKDYEDAYREGHSCFSVDQRLKEYKSHRRVSVSDP